MIEFKYKNQCCGCSACVDLCPKKCIRMREDREGFLYAEVDAKECIECGLCERLCPMIDDKDQKQQVAKAYAAWSNRDDIHTSSTSGGAAYELGKVTLEKGGVVYGCSGVNPYNVRHIRIDKLSDLASTQGSKYVQSSTEGIYRQVRKDVAAGLRVLFIGTPCQAAAVRNMFGKHTPDNLMIVDIICHGVPSQKMLNRQLNTIKRRNHITSIESMSFRQNSEFNLLIKGIHMGVGTMTIKESCLKNPYYKAFFYGLNYRESCYQCSYACENRVGDLSIGDFWGFGDIESLPFEHKKGLSLIFVNNERGEALQKEISTAMSFIERPLEEAIVGNPQLRHPVKRTNRVRIYRLLSRFMPDSVTSKMVFIDRKILRK